MPQLVNTQTNALEDISQDNFHKALTSGQYNLVKGQPINVINPQGELVSLPAEQVPEALQSNFTIPTEQDITTYANKLKYETAPEQVKTFGEAAASGATFGLSREAEAKLLGNQAEQRARQEINPGVSLAGEVTGAVGSAFLAPELAPTALVGKLGAGVTRAAEPVLAGAAKMVANPESSAVVAKILEHATKTGAKALGSAVDASVYGLGQSISEHALGDPDLNAEKVLHNVGYAAALGGALGSTLGLGEAALKRSVPKHLEQAALKDSIMENAQRAPKAINPNAIPHPSASSIDFSLAVEQARKTSPLHELNITAYTPEEYQGFKTFLSPDKQSGFAIKPDGELVSVFSTTKGRGEDLVQEAVNQGASKLDAFDIKGKLPALYEKAGFEEYKRVPNITKGGPDVVYMAIPEKHPELFGQAPSSFEDIAQKVEAGKNLGFTTELPQKQTLLDAEQVLAGESQFPAHALQTQSLESPFLRDYYKTFLEGGSKEAQDMQAYEALQKREGTQLLNKFVKEISPTTQATEDAVTGGNKLVDAFKEQYNAEKKELAPFFEKFDSAAVSSLEDPSRITTKIGEAIPEAEQYIYKTPEQGFNIQPYKSSMPFSKEAHRAISDLLEQLNDPKLTLGGLRNIREAMRDQVNFLTAPRTANEISSLRKSLMDIIQEDIQKLSPDLKVREAFKKYAINEENRKVMERIFGGSISDQATFAKEIKPEDVLSKLFSNTVAIKAAKDILGDKFNPAVADYLSQNMARFTDPAKNGFSSNRFATFLKSKGPELEEALAQKPETLAKIRALMDKLRILPDSPSINPSGTAKTSLLQKMQKLGGLLTPKGLLSIPGQALKAAAQHFEASRQASTIEDILSGKNIPGSAEQLSSKRAQYGALAKIERMGQETTRKITRGISKIFDASSPAVGITAKHLTPEQEREKFDKVSEQIKNVTSSFEAGAESLEKATASLHGVAPMISASLNVATGRASQFLASKLPVQDPTTPFSKSRKPSSTEIATFNRYYSIVENPTNILGHIKNGTLTKEHMEAIQVVYPKLYAEMQNAIMDKISEKMKHGELDLPYKNKLMLSMFLNQDLTESLKQPNISSAQQVYATSGKAKPQQGSPNAGSLSKITKSNRLLTDVQRIESK